jgi:cation:H+ antiporter
MLVNILFFILGLVLLVKGSDFFLRSASSLATKLGISEFIIGMTIVSFGTSIPEFMNSIVASFNGYNEIIIGNITGSNIINLSVILGIAAIFGKLSINREILGRDDYLVVIVSFLFFLVSVTGVIPRYVGLIFIFLYVVYILFLIRSKKRYRRYNLEGFINYMVKFEYLNTLKDFRNVRHKSGKKEGVVRDILIVFFSFGAIILGSTLVVQNAVGLAKTLGVSQSIIAITLIAFGTTLPEMTVSLLAVTKGYSDIAVGNLLGSNIANILLIIGTSSLIKPIVVPSIAKFLTIPAVNIIAIMSLFFMKSGKRISKIEGAFLILSYVAVVGLMVMIK